MGECLDTGTILRAENARGRMAVRTRFAIACSCSLVVLLVVLTAQVRAESVQTTFAVDANTTALYLFKEGTGPTVMNEVLTGKPINVGKGAWVPGRQYYALATAAASESDKSYIYVVDDPSVRPNSAITVEAWVKSRCATGYLVCKNGSFFLSFGDGVFSAEFYADGKSCTASGTHAVPSGQWVHLAATWQRTQTGGTYTGTATIYINGALEASATLTGLPTGQITIPGYGPRFVIGNDDWSSTGAEWDGKVDSLRISSIAHAFTPLYPPSSGPPTPPGNLVPNGDFESGMIGWH